MKRLNIGYLFLALLGCAMDSCTKDELVKLNPTAVLSPTLSTEAVVLTKDGEGTDALTISWPKPDYGFQASPVYLIYLDSAGGDYSGAVILNNSGDLSKTFKSEELNKYLAN